MEEEEETERRSNSKFLFEGVNAYCFIISYIILPKFFLVSAAVAPQTPTVAGSLSSFYDQW